MADSGKPEAFVSLATNDFYATGALTLGKSIRDTGTTRKLALVITSGVSEQMRQTLSRIWDELILVEEMNSGDEESLAVLCRPELGVTFTKVAVWTLTQYSKCVFLDADTLVLQNVDELFLREELSAAPDVGWPDCFNSGVFVFRPSQDTFTSLIAFAQEMGSFDGGDQGLLNLYWGNWSKGDIKFHLPFIYNMTANCSYGYAPALLRFKDDIKIVHFIGPVKPWQHTYLSELDTVIPMPGTYSSQCGIQGFLLSWWRVYSSLDMEPSTLTSITKSQAGSRQSQGRDAKFSHRRDFELGHIDYHGRDSFENILAQISQQVGDLLESETSDPQRSGSLGSLKSRSGSSSKSGSARSSRSKSAGSLSKAEKSSESQEELGSLAHEEGQTQEVSGQELVQEMQEDQMQEMSQTSQPQSQEDLQQGNKEEEFSDSGVRSKPPVPIEAWTMDTQEHTQQEESTKKTCTTDASTSCETVQTVDTASQSVASVCPAVDTTVRSTSPSEPVDQQDHVPVSQALQATGTQEATQKAAITTTPPGTRKGSSVPAAKKKDPTSFVNVKVSPPRVRKGSGLPDVAKKDPTSFVTVNASPPKVRKGSGIPEVAKKDPTSFVTVNASPPGVRKGSGLPEVAKKSPTSFVTVNTSPPGVRKGSSSSPPAVLKKDSTQFVQVSAQGNTTIYGPRKPVAIPDRPPFRLAGTHVAKKSPTTKANPPKSKK